MGSIAAFLTCYFTGLTGFAGVLLALLAGAVAGNFTGLVQRAENRPRAERDDPSPYAPTMSPRSS